MLCRTIPKGLATAAISISIFLAACGDDNKNAGGTVEDQEIIAITDKTISGVSQKGPFVNGSSVTVQELDGETLAQTGNSYEGKIKNDMGEFSVKVTKLASQYALLKANGFYRNEVTGEKSKSQVTLYALTDISNRDEVNVNLLTHLEYERSLYLAADDSVTVAAAKKQAEKEVLATFGITGDFANSEDLNIFGTDDGAAALLAVSVLMQGNLSEADFSERLADYAADIETDGKWGDTKTATKIADWASSKSLGGELENIRNNIAKWNISTDVPAFEKYVYNFWWQNYGLGTCDKKRQGEVLQNTNELSGTYGTYFICDNNAWRLAENIEKDTVTWGGDTGNFNGEIRTGQINKTIYYIYDVSTKTWRNATTLEKDTYDHVNNKDWEDGADGEIKKGSVTDSVYVFDATVWRTADSIEKVLGGCVTAIQDSVGRVGRSHYICNSRKWNVATTLQYDTYKHECSEFGLIIHGNINTKYAYFCYGEDWKRFYGNENVSYGKLVDERDGQIYRTVKIGDQTWMAENLNYADSSKYPSMLKKNWCFINAVDSCEKNGRLYTWSAAIDSVKLATDADDPQDCGYDRTCSLPDTVYGICPPGWHLPTTTEWNTLIENVGGAPIAGKILKSQTGMWSMCDGSSNGTDDEGFGAAPIGHRYYDSFGAVNEGGYFWSATEDNDSNTYVMSLTSCSDYEIEFVKSDYMSHKGNGLSVRCVKN